MLFTDFIQFNKKENLFQPNSKLLLAVSGGVDSVVLCALCKQAGYQFAIAHCNFKLRGADSDRDEQFVQDLAQKYEVPFFVTHFDTTLLAKTAKKSIEATARDLRYAWFEAIRTEKGFDCIVTAHHADDNIETVVMNFFRGTGIKGLRGILPKQQKIILPLLFARRNLLEAFIIEQQLQFVTDGTNAANDYTRNYFRNAILPLISARFPEAAENVLRNIQRFTETELLYQQATAILLKKLVTKKGNEAHIPVLKLSKTIPLNTVVYEIIKDFGFTAHQVADVTGLLQAESGKLVSSASHRIIKNRNWLIIAPIKTTEAQHILIEEKDSSIDFEAGYLRIDHASVNKTQLTTDSSIALLDKALLSFPLLLRKWKTGDYFYPLGMKKKKKINRFLSDQKLSLTQKENTWVIEMDKKIIWVVGQRIDDRFKISSATKVTAAINFSKL